MLEMSTPAQLSEDQLEYLGGYSDASVYISVERTLYPAFTLRVGAKRAQFEPIELLRSSFPSYQRKERRDSGVVTHEWRAKALIAEAYINSVGPHFRLKAGHYQLAQEFIETKG